MDMKSVKAKLDNQAALLKQKHLTTLFQENKARFDEYHLEALDMLMDFSKEKLDENARATLFELAKASNVEQKRDAMFDGEAINTTEGRAVLHTALRNPDAQAQVQVQGVGEISSVLERFLSYAERIRANSKITDVISIGIGGSDLGPQMAVKALAPYHDGPRLHFVSNIDGSALHDVIQGLSPKSTLVIIQSKTFTTDETMTNAHTARQWLESGLAEGEDIGNHLAAVSTNIEAACAFGIKPEIIFGFWDWVGGRYSLWSAIGLPLAIAIGAENFKAFLKGGYLMDTHFQTAPLSQNIPILMGLIAIWRRNYMGYTSTAVIPYDERLSRLPAYLQQLQMESNGKSVTMEGERVSFTTCPVIWGEAGTNAQHSFFQLLHQGTDIIPVDFLIAANPHEERSDHHEKLLANCFAQSKALAFGKNSEQVKAERQELEEADIQHRVFEGDRPSTTLLYPKLTPEMLGKIIALYEHKTFVEAAIWNINAFDQWGVELGKQLAKTLLPMVRGADSCQQDSSTRGLIEKMREKIEAV